MEKILAQISSQFNGRMEYTEKRPGIYQLFVPVYHEDGDMIDIFLTKRGNEYFLGDYGQTLMRLSYVYEIDTPNKEAILNRILLEHGLTETDGNLEMKIDPENALMAVLHVTQSYAKIASMKYFKREVVENLFYEILDEFIFSELLEFKPKKKVVPIPDRDDLEADFEFSPNGHPVYLFGVKDNSKARLATISFLEYNKAGLDFRGWVVNENFEKLSTKDKTRLTNSCDKQFTSLDAFKIAAKTFLQRERS
jgi:hypothetical protein